MLCWLAIGCRPPQQYGAIGDLPLQGGEVIRDCRIGYRTFGQLDARRSNAVLVLPWSMGTSGDLARQIGPGKLVDSSRYFVIAVDALANGVSSSPSNSVLQEGEAFPVFTLRDMVESQHRLVFTLLGLPRLHAVVGISLGGMQAFHWATAYPESVRKVVAIAGSPRSSPADRQRWQSWTGDVTGPAWERAAKRLVALEPRSAWGQLRLDAVDYARQAQAIISNDVSAGFEGSLERAARAVRGQLLVAVSPTDDVVEPAAARELARLAGAELIELDGRCRHGAPSCEKATLWPAISRFLEK